MEDANGNNNQINQINQRNMFEYVQRSGKRPAQPRAEDGKRSHTDPLAEEVITPTLSLGRLGGDLSGREDSDGLNSDGSRMSIPSITIERSNETVIGADDMENKKLKLAFKLDRLQDKCSRYESHVVFLKKCLENNVIPNGLKAYVEPSIGNKDDDFLGEWHGILFECSKKLTNHSIAYSEKTIASTKTEITTTSEQLKALVSEPAYKKIEDSLKKNDETRNKDLMNRKNRKFYRLKYGDREREDRPPAPINRQNEILNNRGQRGLGKPRQEDDFRSNNRRDLDQNRNGNPPSERSRWSDDNRSDRNGRNEWQPEQRYGNNNNSYSRNNNGGDRALEKRVIDVIDRRTRNQSGAPGNRGLRANDFDDSPIHERISLGRRNSRRNVRARNATEPPRRGLPSPQ